MYNNGLQDSELQLLHRKLGLNLNLFLRDILDSSLFKVVENGEYYLIYPLFYCDRIESDGDAFIQGSYLISCRRDYSHIFLFVSDSQVIVDKTYTISNVQGSTWIIYIYDMWTKQPLRNTLFSVEVNGTVSSYSTDNMGYCFLEITGNNFEVIL